MLSMSGLYRHYKGGLYRVIAIAETHEHNGDLDVIYVSLSTGKLVTRPYRKDSRNEDAWLDEIQWPDGEFRKRFVLAFGGQEGPTEYDMQRERVTKLLELANENLGKVEPKAEPNLIIKAIECTIAAIGILSGSQTD